MNTIIDVETTAERLHRARAARTRRNLNPLPMISAGAAINAIAAAFPPDRFGIRDIFVRIGADLMKIGLASVPPRPLARLARREVEIHSPPVVPEVVPMPAPPIEILIDGRAAR